MTYDDARAKALMLAKANKSNWGVYLDRGTGEYRTRRTYYQAVEPFANWEIAGWYTPGGQFRTSKTKAQWV